MKKALAMLLTLAMALSMLPMAFADVAEAPLAEAPITMDEPAPADTAPVPTEEAPLADVDEAIQTAGEITAPVNAGTLQSQIDAANGETTITLTEDVTEDITIPAGKTIILDLAGHKLTNKSGHTITNNGTLTLVGPGTVHNAGKQSALYTKGSVKATGCTFTAESGRAVYLLGGNADITNCTLMAGGTSEAFFLGTYSAADSVNITGSTLTGTIAIATMWNAQGTLALKGDDNAINGSLNLVYNGSVHDYVVTIEGGKFDCGNDIPFKNSNTMGGQLPKDNLILTGGYFKTDVSDYVSPGYECAASTSQAGYSYEVRKGAGENDVAYTVTSGIRTYYETLAGALSAASSGTKEVYLIKGVIVGDPASLNGYTLFGNGNAVEYNGTVAAFLSAASAASLLLYICPLVYGSQP